MQRGINYTETNERERGRISHYHGSMLPLELNKGAKNVDISHLNKRKQQQLFETEVVNGSLDFNSKFTIGFEIEKNELHRSSIKEYALFKGFETDSSCGYEAITHILPLLPPCKWRNKIFNLMVQAKMIIEDDYSPSNNTCGGHITIGVKGMTGSELAQKLNKYMGIIFAIYRKRLSNSYCYGNPLASYGQEMGLTYSNDRYSAMLIKANTIELRLPNRITSVKQMMLRYELMYLLVDTAINKPTMSSNKFNELVKPVISKMYYDEPKKVEFIMWLGEQFNNSIKYNKYNEVTAFYGAFTRNFNIGYRDNNMRAIKQELKRICTIPTFRAITGIFEVNENRESVVEKVRYHSGSVIANKIAQIWSDKTLEEINVLIGREVGRAVAEFVDITNT